MPMSEDALSSQSGHAVRTIDHQLGHRTVHNTPTPRRHAALCPPAHLKAIAP